MGAVGSLNSACGGLLGYSSHARDSVGLLGHLIQPVEAVGSQLSCMVF